MQRSLLSFPSLLWVAAFCLLTSVPTRAQDKTLTARPIADAPSFVKRALIIGIGKYEHAGSLAPTTYNDALRFADLLKTQFKFPEEAITLLTDAPDTPESRRPTFIHLRTALKTLLAGITDKSEVVIYFSGHGTRAEDHDWLVPLDGEPSDVNATCINYDDFKSQLNTRTPARALLIVDACRNLSGGKDAGSSGFGAGKGLTGPQFAELLSCRPKEESKVGKPEDFTESVFTHFLLQGLRGDPEAQDKGVVTFDSLNEYVQGRVSQYVSNKFGESQNPDGRASLGKMVLARGTNVANAAAPALLTPVKDPVLLTCPYKVGDKADYEIEMVSDPKGHSKTILLNYASNVKEIRPDGSAVLENTHFSEEVTLDGKKGEKRAIAGSTLQVWDSHNVLRETRDEGTELGAGNEWLETMTMLQAATAILSDKRVKTGDTWAGTFKSPPYPVRDLPYKVTFLGASRLEEDDTWVFKQVISVDEDGKTRLIEVMSWQSVATGRTVKAEFNVTVQNPNQAPVHTQFRLRQKRSFSVPVAENPGIAVARFKKNTKDDAEMVFIPAGEFTMGSADFPHEKPVHKVVLDGYYIYRTPVTVAQYLKFCTETGHARPSAPDFNPNWSKLDHPIVNVSYNDALAYCEWAGVKLPTEAQWEKAARGTEGRQYPWGDVFDRSNLWASQSKEGDARGTKPVGSFPSGASPFGVLDMAGNVYQWCLDWYDPDFYASGLATARNSENQSVGEKKHRVVRGGSWGDCDPQYFRSAYRYHVPPNGRDISGGFRCVSAGL